MKNRHIIEKTTWDISFGCEDDAFEQQAALGAFAGDRMLAAVDEVFTEMSTPGQVLRIDRLEVDLGTVAYRGFQQELDRRLRERLREALQAKLQSLKAAPAPNEGIVAEPQAELAQIEYFLANGHLPWNAIPADGRDFDQMIRRVIRLNGAQLVQFLKSSAHRVSVVIRLVRQSPTPVLHDMVRLLAPAAAGALIGLIADLQKIGGQVGALPLSQRDWADLLWQELLLDLLRMPPSLVTPRMVVARILEKISHRRNQSHERMLTLLVGHVLDPQNRAGQNPALAGVLQRLLESARSERQGLPAPADPDFAPEKGNLSPSDSRAAGKGRRPAAPADSSAVTVLLERLAEALKQGRADGIEDIWHTLLRQEPKQLKEIIRYYGRLADIRKKIAAGFPAGMLRDAVRLLEPGAAGFIEEIVDRPQLFRKAGRKQSEEPERLERRLWEFTLTYLLAERGSRFNRKAYIGSLLRQMAAHDNIEFQELLGALAGVLEQVAVPSALKTELLKLLEELAGKAGGTSPLGGAFNSRPQPLPRTTASNARDPQRLQAGALPETFDEDDLKVITGQWTREQTARLLDFLRNLQVPKFGAARAQGLPDKIIAALRPAGIQAAFPGHRPAPAGSHADTVGYPPGGAKKPHASGKISAGAEEEPSSPRANFLRARLAAAIRRGNARIIQAVWPSLLHEHPNLLKKALKHYGRQSALRRKMAEGFSETMLKDIIRLLEPTDSGFMEELVTRPQLLQPGRAEMPQKSGRHKRRLWEFTLAYLLAERGGRFNRKAYLGFLVRQMAAHDNVRARDLLTAIIRTLQATKGSDALKNEMLQLLTELAGEMDGRRPGSIHSVSPGRHVIRSIRLSEDLRHDWISGNFPAPSTAGDPAEIIAELARFYPWQVSRLHRDLQAGRLSLDTAVARLPVAALRRLLEAFIYIVRQDGRNRSDDFMRAVETFGERARNQRRFYRQILQHVLSNRAVDFEKILDENRSTPLAEGPAKTGAHPAAAPEIPKPPVKPAQETRPADDRDLARLADYLGGSRKIDAATRTRLNHLVELLIAQHPERLRHLLAGMLAREETAARLIDLLPERLLTRLLYLTHRAEHHRIQQAADTLVDAAGFEAVGLSGDRLQRLKWQFIFKFLFKERRPLDEGVFVRRFAADLAAQSRLADAGAFHEQMIRRLHHNSLPGTRPYHLALIEALAAVPAQPLRSGPAPQPTEIPGRTDRADDAEQTVAEEIYIDNAGLVLTSPYLPRLFNMLNLTEGPAFKNRETAERAVHLLQFMVNESSDAPEFQLALNKILCGVKTGIPIARGIEISAREQETLEGLLQGMIANWKAIGKTSLAGLRESFLQREGWLRLKDDAWHLLVEPRAFDMLLDRLPWSFGTIKHPWMARVVHVKWR